MIHESELTAATLPQGFQFSQGSLQDFEDCPRRFQLRYLWNLSWPAVESEPVHEGERFMRQGAAFHQLVHQHQLGVPAERLAEQIKDETLFTWWENYLVHTGFVHSPDVERGYPEITLSAPLAGFRLVGKYDLLLFHTDGRATIVDWKTSRVQPRRDWLKKRLQTRVYPFLLACASGGILGGQTLTPDKIEMIYWFTNFPTQPIRFEYSSKLYQSDETYLAELITRIQRLGGKSFPLTPDESRCRFCVYRSLCDRGVKAGSFEEAQQELEESELAASSFDLEQVAEVEF